MASAATTAPFINFLQFYYNLTKNTFLVDNKNNTPPSGISNIIFKNGANICYINAIFHILRQMPSLNDAKNSSLFSEINNLIEKQNAEMKKSSTQQYSKTSQYTTYFLYEFKEEFKQLVLSHFQQKLGIQHPQLSISKRGGVALQLLCSVIIPSLTTKTTVKYKSKSGDQRVFNYLNIDTSREFRYKTLLNSHIVNEMQQHITTCDNIKIPTDPLFITNFNHNIDFPYDNSNRPGLGLSSNYLTLEPFSMLNPNIKYKVSPQSFAYFNEILQDLIQLKIITLTSDSLQVASNFTMIEDGDHLDLNKKYYIFTKDEKKILSSHKPISHMSFYICNNCNTIFPYKSEQYCLSYTDEYIILNKSRQIPYQFDITKPLTFASATNTQIIYKPIAFTCAFLKDQRLRRSHIIAITLEKNNKFYLYEDERIPIEVDPNKFNIPENEIIIIYKLQ
jgi:hypothetical protein